MAGSNDDFGAAAPEAVPGSAAPELDEDNMIMHPYIAICPPCPMLQPPPRETLTDGTVTLRRWRASDETSSAAAAAAGIGAKEWDDDRGWDYAITVTKDGDGGGGGEAAVIGSCGLRRRTDNPGLDLSYCLAGAGRTGGHKEKEKGGVEEAAMGAVRLLTNEAFAMVATSVRIVHDRADLESRAVPEKLGFECQDEAEAEFAAVRNLDSNDKMKDSTAWIKWPA